MKVAKVEVVKFLEHEMCKLLTIIQYWCHYDTPQFKRTCLDLSSSLNVPTSLGGTTVTST